MSTSSSTPTTNTNEYKTTNTPTTNTNEYIIQNELYIDINNKNNLSYNHHISSNNNVLTNVLEKLDYCRDIWLHFIELLHPNDIFAVLKIGSISSNSTGIYNNFIF